MWVSAVSDQGHTSVLVRRQDMESVYMLFYALKLRRPSLLFVRMLM